MPTIILEHAGIGGQAAIASYVAAAAFLLAVLFYSATRGIGVRRFDAGLLCALMLSAGGAMFWLPILESFALEGAGNATQREEALAAIHDRADDPWPLREGYFLWGAPGAPIAEKGYFEPAGSLSPRVGGPGMSIWAYDANDSLVATSDTIRAVDAAQEFVELNSDTAPAVSFRTPYYRAQWRQLAPNRWQLEAKPQGETALLALSIRGVGPASGRVREIKAEGAGTVRIDGCWRVSLRGGAIAFLGEEGAPGWRELNHAASPTTHESESGWASSRLSAPPGASLEADISNTCTQGERPRWALDGGASLSPADSPLARILQSERRHLLMSFDGTQTRPGDPISYPLQWQRDGGYIVVAMVRAGRLDVARDLIPTFAEHDFFGGFGSEADAPGIALWAIGEVTRAARDPALDTAMWPHVRRKADFILELLTAREDIRRPFIGPLILEGSATDQLAETDLVARPSSHGLIRGRMDWHEPLLYVNAFAWRGLLEAVEIANRLGARDDASRWQLAASQLLDAWRKQFQLEGLGNERTTMSALWPTWAAAHDRPHLAALLSEIPTPSADAPAPKWTYFEVATAHQRMLVGDVKGAWDHIEALMARSPLPSLGVLWEDSSGGRNWEPYRVGENRPPLMPHYWAASELLLFALESLAYVDETEPRALVIGGGLRPEWLDKPLSVRGLVTRLGRVDWSWNGEAVTVALETPDTPVRLGPAFPSGTRIERASAGLHP